MGIGRLDGTRFNLIMSVRHNASAARLQQWRDSFQRASEMLFDATDGQHQLGTIYVCNNSSGGRNADGWLLEEDGRSSAGGLGVLGSETIHMSLYGDERFKPFVLTHELIHYLYGPADEYSGPGGSAAECLGDGVDTDACIMERGWWEGDRFGDDATGGTLVVGEFSELCVASNHDPDGDTHQENVHGEDCWQTVVDEFSGLTIPTDTPTGPEPSGAATIDWIELAPEERFVLVVDRSGSMAGSKLDEAKYGADWWAQQALDGELLGVVSYATTVSSPPDYALQTITGDSDRADAATAVAGISAGGLTAMGDAMRAALDEFLAQGQRAATQVVVLLTDGLTNTGEDPANVVDDLVANGVRVYPIGIGGSINTSLLEQIASDTGGTLYRIDPSLPMTDQETAIRNALIEISGIARDGGGVVTTQPEAIAENSDHEAKVLIEEGSELATFAVSWPSDRKVMLFVDLEAPDGTHVGTADPGVRELGGRRPWHGFHVHKPQPGVWKMRVHREVGEPGTPFRRVVFSRNRAIDGGIRVSRGHKPGAIVPIDFQLYHEIPLENLKLDARVRLPNGKEVPLDLEPLHGRGTCAAGYLRGWFPSTKAAGTHSVIVRATADGATRVGGGERTDEEPDPVVVPSFTRVFTADFQVGREPRRGFDLDPDNGARGSTLKVRFKGHGTGWYPRGTRVSFGPGIKVRDLEVLAPTQMVATIWISDEAPTGHRTVTVSTPRREGDLELEGGFTVTQESRDKSGPVLIGPIRLNPRGDVVGLLLGDRVVPVAPSAVSTLTTLRRSGAAIRAHTDEDGNITGFDVD